MQTTLLGLAIAVILALLTALLGPYFVDWNRYRENFEAEAARLVGSPVRVTGTIDARLLPSPSLILNGIEVGNPGGENLLRVRALGIEFGLGPLVRGELRAVDMRLIAPELTVTIDSEGRAALPNTAPGFYLGALAIERLRIEDARLALVDKASGTKSALDKLWFQGDMRSLAGPFRGEGAFVWSGGLYGYRISAARPDDSGSRIKFSIDPSHRPLAIEGEGNLAIERGVPRFDGSLLVSRPVGAVLASGATQLNEPWRATTRVKANSASALFEQIEFQYGPEERALKLSGTAELKFGAAPRLEGVISGRQIDLDRLGAAPDIARTPLSVLQKLAESFGGALRPPLPVQLGIGIDGVTLGGASVQNLRADAATTGTDWTLSTLEFRAPGFTQIQASGRLDVAGASFTGPVDLTSVDPRALLGWFGGRGETPGAAAKPLRARGDMTLARGNIAIEGLKAEFDRKAIEGRLAYSTARDGRKARLDAQLKAAEFDIDGVLDFATGTNSGAAFERPGEVSLALDIGRGQLAGVELKQTSAKLTYDSTGLAIERLRVGDFGGMTLDAKGKIDTSAASPHGSVTLSLTGRDLSGAAALAAKFAPQSAGLTRALFGKSGATRLQASLDVDAADGAGRSNAKLVLDGSLGAIRLNLKGEGTGSLSDLARSDLRLQGALETDDTNSLLLVSGLDRLLTAQKGPGRLMLSAEGLVGGDVRFDTRLEAADLDARADGVARPLAEKGAGATFNLVVNKADAAPLRRLAGRTGDALPVTLNARASLAASALTLEDISATIAGTPLRGRLAIAFAPTVGIDGQIDAGTIDGAALIAAAAGMPAQRDPAAWPTEPFAAGLLGDVQGRVAVRVSRVDLGSSVTATNLRTNLRLLPSQIALEAVEGELIGGRVGGELSLRRSSEGLSARGRITLKAADASQLIAAEGSPPVIGRVGLDVEFEGTGLSPRALVGSLNGAGSITLEGGRITGLDAKAFSAAMRAVDAGMALEPARLRDVVMPALDAGPLVVPNADGAITVSAGQARLGTLVAHAEGADVAISGNYDLSDRSVDARILLSGPAALTSAGRPELAIAFKGPATAPKRTLDVSNLAGWLALRSVEQQSKKLEAIERGTLPALPASPPPAGASQAPAQTPQRPAAIAPERKPQPREQATPLPPPIDIKPAPGERRPASRAESELGRPRAEERRLTPPAPAQPSLSTRDSIQ